MHKKYTYKDGKRYGPYVYETKRIGDRIVTNYLGPESSGWKKKLLLLVGIVLIVAVTLLLFSMPAPSSTGRVSFDLQVNSYLPGQKILGVINLFFKPGEFVQQNSIVRVKLGDQVKDVQLADLIHSNVVENGNYYAEGVQLTGSGPGFGEEGEIISSPYIDAELRVFTPDSDVSLSPDDSDSTDDGSSATGSGSDDSDSSSVSETQGVDEGALEQGVGESSSSDSSNDQGAFSNEPNDVEVKEPSSSSSDQEVSNSETSAVGLEGSSSSVSSEASEESADSTDSSVTGNVVSGEEQIIPIRVSRNEPYSYKLEPGQDAELVRGSVSIDGEPVSDNVLSVDVNNEEAEVTTSFFTTVSGYGPEFLGKEPAFTVHIDIDDLDLIAQEGGDISVELIGENQVIASHKENIAVAEPTLDVPVEPVALSPPVLSGELPSVRLSPEEIATIDLSLNFKDAMSYAIEISDIDATIEGSLLTLHASQDKIARRAVVTASNDAGEIISSFLVVVSSGSISYKTEGKKIVVKAGEQSPPVELTTTVTSDEPLSSISLPASATNIEVNKEVNGELVVATEPFEASITGGITGNVIIEVDAGKNAKNSFKHILKRIKAAFTGNVIAEEEAPLTQPVSLPSVSDDTGVSTYVVTYEVPAPIAEVKDTEHGQKLLVSGPDDYHFSGVIVSSDITRFNVRDPSQIQLFLLTDSIEVSDELLKDPSEVEDTFVDTVTDTTLAEPDENGVITPEPSMNDLQTIDELPIVDESQDASITGNAIAESAPELTSTSELTVEQEKRRVAVPFDVYDTDDDGFLDYLELATSLSEQEYEIIIIVNANHLDENRTFVSDVYDSVRELDGNWSETIPDGHYVRVTFERNLTNDKDITIYPRVVSGTPRVEVFEAGSDTKLEEFSTLNENQYNKIYLTNLTLPQDTFDLRVVGGACEFDHIIDPTDNGSLVQYTQTCINITTDNSVFYVNGSFTPAGNAASCINISAVNVTFDCAGYNIVGTTYAKSVVLTNRDYSTIRNCNLSSSATSGGIGIKIADAAGYTVINNNTIHGRLGVQLTGTGTNILIANTSVLGTGGVVCTNAISITGSPANSTIVNFTGNGCTGNLIAGATNTLINFTLSQNSFVGSGGANAVNLQIESSVIDGNNFSGSSGSGFALAAGSGPNNIIKNNIFGRNSGAGIKLLADNNTLLFMNNTLFGNSVGLNVTNSLYGNFTGNYFDNNTIGLAVYPAARGNYFSNNVINRSTSVALKIEGVLGGSPVVEGATVEPSNNTYQNISVTSPIVGALDVRVNTTSANNASLFTLVDSSLGNYSFGTGVGNLRFKSSRYGELVFLPLITASGINLSSDINIANNSVYFNASVSGLNRSANVTLYGLPTIMTNPLILRDGVDCGGACYNFTALTAGTVVFNVSYGGSYSVNYTAVGGDITAPLVTVNLPANITYNSLPILFNATLNEDGVCNYTLDSGVTNLTMQNNGNRDFNATNATIVDRSYTAKYYCADTSGNLNYTTSVVFSYASPASMISFVSPTPANASSQTGTSIFANVSSNDSLMHYTFVDFNRDLRLWMRFDDTNSSSDFTDLSSWSNNGSKSGPTIVSGKFGNAASYTQSTDRVVIADAASIKGLSQVTISAWINTSAAQAARVIAGKTGGGTGGEYFLATTATTLRFTAISAVPTRANCDLAYTYNTGRWIHLVGTYNGSTMLMYVNGTLVSATCDAIISGRLNSVASNFVIGDYAGFTQPWNGTLDEVIMWNRTLSGTEILSLYNASVNKYSNNFTNLAIITHNITGYAVNTAGKLNQTEKRQITITTTLPGITLAYPTNTTYAIAQTALNYSVTNSPQACWYTTDSGVTNTTNSPCAANVTGLTSTHGSNTWIVYANDSSGNVNSSSVTFSVDLRTPTINFTSPTPGNNTSQTGTSIFVNVSSNDSLTHYTFVDFNRDLRLWMRFDDLNASNGATDLSSWSNNGSNVGSSLVYGAGRFGNGVTFNGAANNYLLMPTASSLSGLTEITLSAWFNTSAAQVARVIVSKHGGGTGGEYFLGTSATGLRFTTINASATNRTDCDYTTTYNTGQWMHTVGTYNGSTAILYLNGSVVATCYQNGRLQSTSNNLIIGDFAGFTQPWNGSLDDVLIFNRSFSAGEVSALYNATATQYARNFTGLAAGQYNVTGYTANTIGHTNQTEKRQITITANAAPTIVSYSLNYTNYWMKNNQTLPLNVTCSDPNSDVISYNWTVDGVQASNTSNFTMPGANYAVSIHNVSIACSDPSATSTQRNFTIEILNSDDFVVVALPDTQYYSQSYPYVFDNQTAWTSEIQRYLGPVIVLHEGDVVQDGYNDTQWQRANSSMTKLDVSGVNYELASGNHDYLTISDIRDRNLSNYTYYFPLSRFQAMSSYGGSYDGTGANSYHFFNQSGIQFMALTYEFCPRNETLDWANSVISANQDKRVIITTHLYMNHDDTRENATADYSCFAYSLAGDNDGEEQWGKLVANHSNIFLVLSGHILGDGSGYRNDTGQYGNVVHQILANYQSETGNPNGGNGWLRLYVFRPSQNKVDSQAYSPYIDVRNSTSAQTFTMGYNFTSDILVPSVNIVYPINTTYASAPTTLNYTASDATLQDCWYSTDSGVTNRTIICGANVSNMNATEGSNAWMVSVNDTAGNVNTSSVTFSVDSVAPQVQFVTPTETNASTITRNNILINATATDTNLVNLTIKFYNSTSLVNQTTTSSSPNFVNITSLPDGTYTFNATATDSFNNVNTTETRTVTLTTAVPGLNLTYPLNTSYTIVQTALNYTVTNSPYACWYSTDLGATNTTVTCGTNVTGLTSSQGSNTWIVYANNSAGAQNSSRVTFSVDSIAPVVTINSPSSNITTNTVVFNVTTNEVASASRYTLDGGLNNVTMQNNGNIDFNATNTSIADGTYTVRYYVNDTAGNLNSTATFTFIVDRAAPNFTITSPQNITYTSNNITVNFTSSDLSGISTRWFYNGTGNESYSGVVYRIAPQGSNTFIFYSNDSLGNFNSSSVIFSVDSLKPTVNFTFPTPVNGFYQSSTSVVINVTGTEGNFGAGLVELDATNYTMTCIGSSTYYCNYTFTGLSSGVHTIIASVNDTFGNRNATETRTFTIDLVSPLVSITVPQNTSYGSVQTALNYTVSDSLSGVETCKYSTDLGATNTTVTCGTNVTGLTSSQGSNIWIVYVNDTVGNVNSSTLMFSVDSIAPVVTINLPANTTYNSLPILFNATLNEAGNYCNYTLTNGGLNYTMQKNGNTDFNGTNASMADGQYTVRYLCADTLGNLNSTTNRTFSLDATLPLVTINSPTSNVTVSQVTFNVTTNENAGTALFSLNSGVTNVTMQKNGNTDFNYTNTSIADGNYVVNFYVNDTSGNTNRTTSRAFTVDTLNPALNLTYPLNTTYTSVQTHLNYTVSDTNLQACWYFNGTANNTITCGNNVTGLNSNEGSNTWIVYANDTLGRLNTSSVTFSVQTTAPNFTITSPQNATYTSNNITVNFTSSDLSGISTRWFYNGTGNETYTGVVYRIASQGSNTWIFYSNNTLNTFNSTSVTFSVDSIAPQVQFVTPTETNASLLTRSNIVINVTATDTNFANVTAHLYNITGLVNQTTGTSSPLYLNLTGLNNGVYYFNASARDTLNNINWTETRTVTIDSIVPNLTINSPTNITYATANISVNLTSDGASVWFYNGTGNETYTAPVYRIFSQGVNTLLAYANDTAGNVNASTITFSVDSVRPLVAIVYPTNASYSSSITALNYTVSDLNLQACWYSINNGVTNSTITCSSNVTNMNSTQGSNTWTVYANDSSGNSNSSSVTFSVDSLGPQVTVNLPANITYNSLPILFNVTLNEDGLCNYTLTGGVVNVTMQNNGNRDFNATNATIVDGSYLARYYCRDSLGNLNGSETRGFSIDTTAPLVTINSPTTNVTINQVTFNVTTNENAIALFSLNSGVTNVTMQNNGNRDFNYTNTSIADGTYTVRFYVNDSAGNLNATASFTFNVDASVPNVQFVTPTETNASSLTRSNILINVTATDVSLSNITIVLYNSTGLVNRTTTVSSPNFVNITSLSDGTYTFNATATDSLNNINTTQTRTITILTSIPGINLIYPTNTTYTSVQTHLNYTVTNSPYACWYSTDLGVTNTTVTCGTNVTGLTSSQGSNTWSIYVNNSFGATNTSSVTFVVDSFMPQVNFGIGTDNSGEFVAGTIYINSSINESNVANVTYNLYNSTARVNSTTFSSLVPTFNFTNLADGTYTYQINVTDILNNKNGTSTRSVTSISSCLNSICSEDAGCVINSTCTLHSGLCTGGVCDFVNLTVQNTTIYTLYDGSGNGNSLVLNITSNLSSAVRFFNVSQIIFSGKNGSTISPGTVGGNGSIINITVMGLFNRTQARFIGLGGYTTLSSGAGGNGGILQLNYHGLIRNATVTRFTAGNSSSNATGSYGIITLAKDSACPRDEDVTDPTGANSSLGIINSADVNFITLRYGNVSTDSTYQSSADVNCDNVINIIDLAKVGFKFGTR